MRTTIVVLVEDKPGVLARVASQFRRHVFNIQSMDATTSGPGLTTLRMTVDDEQRRITQLVGSLSKLINVLQVEEQG